LNAEDDRPYDIPFNISTEDLVELTRLLAQIEPTNPTLSSPEGTGETRIADFIDAWLPHRDIESRRLESTPGHPSIVGIVSGKGTLNGHYRYFQYIKSFISPIES
jgi:acetylornithine deacetylase/succinyl-diaminopimelate desuccinylase-like protein